MTPMVGSAVPMGFPRPMGIVTGGELRLRIEAAQFLKRDLQPFTHAGQCGDATLGAGINFGAFGQGFGEGGATDSSHFGKLMKPVRTWIQIVALDLIGRRMSASSVNRERSGRSIGTK
jgi:hypothetical protein